MKTNGEAVKWYPILVETTGWDGTDMSVRMINTVNNEFIDQYSGKKFVEQEEYENVFQAYKKLERKIARIKRRQNKKHFQENSQSKFKVGDIVYPNYEYASWSEGVVTGVVAGVGDGPEGFEEFLRERLFYTITKSISEDKVNTTAFDFSNNLRKESNYA